ncbi:hypothetical protein B566_EDAN015319 [Ephemera danica]|nr:hypothetical protein B566_EDAN015319 [Ephemera danica]
MLNDWEETCTLNTAGNELIRQFTVHDGNDDLIHVGKYEHLLELHTQLALDPVGDLRQRDQPLAKLGFRRKTQFRIPSKPNQIAAQQAIYVKQQQHQQHMAPQGPQTGDFFKPQTLPDPISALHGNFGELSMKEPQQASFQTQQSRLNQWKLPSLDKDGDGNEFDRAPGTTTKTQSHTSPNMNPLLPQGDSTWSSVGRGGGDTGWPDTSAPGDGGSQSDGKEWPNSAAQASAAFTDLVPEFEPGKPWKGNQMKSIEDDPSITPGSVVRSPLSLATIKDTEIFSSSNKTSPPASVVASSSDNAAIPSLSLSSTTWSFNPTSSSSSAFARTSFRMSISDCANVRLSTAFGCGSHVDCCCSLGTNGSNGSGRGGPTASSWGGMPPGGGWSSTWLLLRNLTPQIDGSTLKTLCLQHGPLQSFHLYLNHGLALAKYQSREEAAKAQGALNNCVLGNTTIFAESPAEAEVHGLLQHLHVNQPQGPSVASGWGSMRGGGPNSSQNAPPQQGPQPQQQGPSKPPPDAWGGGSSGGGGSQLWPSPSSSSLWGSSGLDGGDQHRATPSSLNSFLPGDLLGEGSM